MLAFVVFEVLARGVSSLGEDFDHSAGAEVANSTAVGQDLGASLLSARRGSQRRAWSGRALTLCRSKACLATQQATKESSLGGSPRLLRKQGGDMRPSMPTGWLDAAADV